MPICRVSWAMLPALILVPTSACSQTSVSPVVLYGNVDVALGGFQRAVSGEDLRHRLTKLESGVFSGSYLGIRGQEVLPDGGRIFFKLEATIAVDSGAATPDFWGRTSEVGVVNDAGTWTVGNSLSLSFRGNLANSPFTVFRPWGLVGVTNFGAFQRDTLTYASPVLAGFQVSVQHGLSGEPGGEALRAVQGSYVRGAWTLVGTYTAGAGRRLWQWGGTYRFQGTRWFAQLAQADSARDEERGQHAQVSVRLPLSERLALQAAWMHAHWHDGTTRDTVVLVYEHGLTVRSSAYAGGIWQARRGAGARSDLGRSGLLGVRLRF